MSIRVCVHEECVCMRSVCLFECVCMRSVCLDECVFMRSVSI